MKSSIIDLLRCPVCGKEGKASEDGKILRCMGARTHCFDFSKSGYLNLSGPHGGAGDLKSAVRARSLFLECGHYKKLSNMVNQMLSEIAAKRILDAGCGEGYYTNRMTDEGRVVLGVDLSTVGIDHASKCAKHNDLNAGYVVASLFKIPVADGSVDAVTNLFAPCAEEEFLRILRPGGYLILVSAGEKHLLGLKQVLYEKTYSNQERADLPQNMELISMQRLTYEIEVEGREQIDALFSMTPYYWRTSEQDKEKLQSIQVLNTEVDFTIYLYRKGTQE